jgi:hypothetical protein
VPIVHSLDLKRKYKKLKNFGMKSGKKSFGIFFPPEKWQQESFPFLEIGLKCTKAIELTSVLERS